MLLEEIRIPGHFKNTRPSQTKFETVRDFYKQNGKLDKPMVLKGKRLIDGYIRYLVLVDLGVTEINETEILSVSNAQKYVWGRHLNSVIDKEYVWKCPKDLDVKVNDTAIVVTKFGYAPITVTQVKELDSPPVEGRIKKLKYVSNKEN